MTRDQAKDYIKADLVSFLCTRGINPGRPFRCLNPYHEDQHPSMHYDANRNKCHCFSCGADYDTFDLIGIEYGLTDNRDIFNKAYELYGLSVENNNFKVTNNVPTSKGVSKMENNNNGKNNVTIKTQIPKAEPDFTSEVEAAHQELLGNDTALSYLLNRGLTSEILSTYKIGYHAKGYNDLLKAHPECQCKSPKENLYRLVFPYFDETGKVTYLLSEIIDRTQVDKYNGKYRKMSKGTTEMGAELFNERYLKMDECPEVIYICEGIYDALSIEVAGGHALAFIGVAHRRFLSLCTQYKPNTTFVLMLDNDGAGHVSTEKVMAGLDELGIPYIVKKAEHGKDPNEALQIDRDEFCMFIQNINSEIQKAKKEAEELVKQEYMKTSALSDIEKFWEWVEASKKNPCLSTGFGNLDELLDGGLYPGLYFVGAISSLGKTTFCLQMMDQIAKNGHDVLIFSLEMSRMEIIAKSLSRYSYNADIENFKSVDHAKTTRGILAGSCYDNYTTQEITVIKEALQKYAECAEHIYIHEGVGNIGVQQIREIVEHHIKVTKNIPVVLIDYIQILAPYNDRATDKQNTDKAVLELKRLSRDHNLPLIGISSFNRDNYNNPVNMASFKESGAVEYSSDVLIGLQYAGMDYEDGENEKERLERIRHVKETAQNSANHGGNISIQLKVLKNRNGKKGDICFDFSPIFNCFMERSIVKHDGWKKVTGTETIPFD